MKNTLAIVALASCITTLCRAASPPAVPEGLLACRKLQDESQRVRCYDAQVDRMSAAVVANPAQGLGPAPAGTNATPGPVAAGAAANAAPGAAAAPARGAASAATPASAKSASAAASQQASAASFGQETLPPTTRPTTSQEETALASKITALHAVRPQLYAISLANGQVWRQEEASATALFFRVGDDVRIEKGVLGSYRMSTAAAGAKNWVRVTRIQ